jgi:protein-tyrosine phosphatase
VTPAAPSSVPSRLTDGPQFVRARYGTLRGLVRLLLSRAAYASGRYAAYSSVNWRHVERLVFVCAGNICRSPYAEYRAAHARCSAMSIALRGGTGEPADPVAQSASAAAGTDLVSHRSTSVADYEPLPGDLLVAMEPWQADELVRRFANLPDVQVTLLGLWSKPRRPHIHDPFGLGPAYFRTCFRVIDSGVAGMLARIAP